MIIQQLESALKCSLFLAAKMTGLWALWVVDSSLAFSRFETFLVPINLDQESISAFFLRSG